MTIPIAIWQRYAGSLLRYGSLGKLANAARAAVHWLAGSAVVSSKPLFLKVEISRHCTVNCRYCHVPKERVFYPLDKFKALIDELGSRLFQVSLYEVGEPLENDLAAEYIRYAHAKRIGTVVSTSLSLHRPDSFWRDLVGSGLDRLIVAIDGVTEEVYRQYRTQGDLALVMANLRRILQERSSQRSRLCVEWQMLDLPWNRVEHDAARDLAKSLGCDVFRIIPEMVLPRQQYSQQCRLRHRNCLLPYLVFVVNAYGKVQPCYKPTCYRGWLGDLTTSTFQSIWNGDEIAQIRDAARIQQRPGCQYCLE